MSQASQVITSKHQAGSFLPLLRERDNDFKVLALNALLNVVDLEWSEIADELNLIKNLHLDETFPERQLAAYLGSKVYYHLGDMNEALNLALESGKYFNLEQRTQFNECLTWHCLDQYIAFRQAQVQDQLFSQKKESMVINVIKSSYKQGNLFSALGVSFDCRRLDMVQDIMKEIPPQQLPQVLQLIHTVPKGEFRDSVLKHCVEYMHQQHKSLQVDEWANFVSVLVGLNEVVRVAEILWELIQGDSVILAYQLAIDLSENQRPQFMNQLVASLPVQEAFADKRQKLINILNGELQRKATMYFLKEFNQADQSILTQIKTATDPKQSVPHGGALMAHAIMQTGTQDSSFLRSNLGNDKFNMIKDWATKCNYWLRFTTTATLGMIYKGNYEKSNEVLAPYLPQEGTTGSANVFENGGALYALGLINQSTRNPEIIMKLTDAIRNQQLNKSEQVIHGACLGLGLVTFSSEDSQIADLLREVLFKNESVYGEAAALSIGLVYAGSNNMEVAQELLTFSRQSDKDKIVRQLGTSIAAILFGMEDKADVIIDSMLADSEPYVRYGGCLSLAMAYVGTGSNKVIERLLKQAVNDVADEVRRIAVISIAFVMFKNYEAIPKVMRLLILSYNPHIRYGTAIAIGIACAGTMYTEAINMLEPMLNDNVDFVRQGALIAISLVLMQANNNCEAKFEAIKKTISELQTQKHQTVLVKLGVFLSQGILDAGGRNLTVQLASKQGFPKLEACVGMMIFTHYWFWFPLLPFMSMALAPTAIIALNENLQIPKKFQFQSNSKATQFGYPAHIKHDEKKVQEKKIVQLSTTNRVKARQSRKEAERQGLGESSIISLRQGESQMSLEQQPSQQGLIKHHSAIISTTDDANKMKVEETPIVKKEEPSITILNNPSRVLEKQKKLIQYLPEQRYEPLFKDRKQGLIMLIDHQPGDADDFIDLFVKPKPAQSQIPKQTQPAAPQQAGTSGYVALDEEVQPPEEFEFDSELQNKSQQK